MATPLCSDLYLACRNGDMAAVERLLRNTSVRTLNTLEPNGSTCLHAASYHGHREIVLLLLKHGASRRTVNGYGCTPFDEARTQEVADLFPRTSEAAKKRFSGSPATQPEWQFEDANAEHFSRAIHWGCIKDRGIKKTVKELNKAHLLAEDDEKAAAIVKDYFDTAKETKDPVYLLKAYTVESEFYRKLNREMATGSRREVFKKLCKKWTGYYTGMIVRNPAFEPYRFTGQTFRGMQITPSEFAQYRRDNALTNKSFQSTSKSWKIAKGFACPAKPKPGTLAVVVIFTITDRRSALSIESISEYQTEEEVLIVPGTFFLVTNVNENEIPHEVELQQIQWENEF